MADAGKLIAVFEEARVLLADPANDFDWSSWRDSEHALEEIDEILAALRSGKAPDPAEFAVLFAPTGPMQEVSVSSGWGTRFLDLADRFDAAS